MDTVKSEAMMIRLKNMGSLFRTLEFLFAILFLCWSICTTSPYISSLFHLLRRLSSLILNHHFVFLLGNAIILTLFIKFAQFECHTHESNNDDYHIPELKQSIIIPTEKEVTTVKVKQQRKDIPVVVIKTELPVVKRPYRRSRSNETDNKRPETIQPRRSETQPRRNSVKEVKFEVDDLSNEEFRQKVEFVIEKHRRSLRQESMFIVTA